MQKNLTIILMILLYSCGGDDSTSPSNESKYHSNDEAFLSQLIESGGIERDTLINRITVESVEISGEEYDRIIEMNLTDLELDNLPSSIGDLQFLEELDLSNNYFSDLPEELCEVYGNGVVLKIENNLLCDPTTITHCILDQIKVKFEEQNCESVFHDEEFEFIMEFIGANEADTLSEEIFGRVKWDWNENDSTMINNKGQHINRIIEIEWNSMEVDSIPETIQKLKYLKSFELENNLLRYLPSGITSLSQLEDLQIYNNLLAELPFFIGNMTQLSNFEANNNLLETIPESIGDLVNLTTLTLQNNNITTLPESLCNILDSELSINLVCNLLDSNLEGTVPECVQDYLGNQNCGQ